MNVEQVFVEQTTKFVDPLLLESWTYTEVEAPVKPLKSELGVMV
jgi:hypothetical protein